MKRGIAVGVLLALAVIGGLWLMRRGHRDSTATQTATPPKASPVAKSVPKPTKLGHVIVGVGDGTHPIAGAIVRIAPEAGDVIAIQTDKEGHAIVDLPGGSYDISASAAGHEPASAPRLELGDGDDAKLAIVLSPGGRLLSGTVTDVSGGPIAGARIDAAKLGGMARPDRAVASVLTGADGKYQLAVAEGQLFVAARSADYSAQSRIVDVGPSGATADFSLVPGGVIEGVVLDEKTHTPVAGAMVRAHRDTAMMLAETGAALATAGSDGKFRFAGLRPGAYELGAIGEGKRSKAPTIVGLGVAEQVSDVEILVGKSPVVRGTVVDENGAGVAKARVMSMGVGGMGEENKADDKGAFVIEGLRPGKYHLIGSSPEHFGNPTPIEIKDADLDGVVIRVKRGAKLVGRVDPAQSCTVHVDADVKPGGGMRFMRLVPDQTTGADGKFEFGGLDEGPAAIEARCPNGDQGKASADVKSGMPEVVVHVTPGGSIGGRVVDGQNKPVAGVAVMATPDDGPVRTTIVNGVVTSGIQALTNGNGAYEVRGLSPGKYRMGVLDRGRPMKMKKAPTVTLANAEKKTGVDLAVDRPNGVIKGIVNGPDGKPLQDAWVSVHQDFDSMLESMVGKPGEDEPPGGRSMQMSVQVTDDDDGGGMGDAGGFPPALTDAQGRFEIRGLPHGKYQVIAEAQAGKLRGRQQAEPDADVTIVAAGVTTLSGTVKGPKGPPSLFTVILDGPTDTQRTFTDGKFEIGRVDPGNYTVKIESSDGNGEAKVVVSPGMPATVEVTLVANAVVTGTIVDGANKPVSGVAVAVIDDAGDGNVRIMLEGPPATSGNDGKFRVEHKAGKGVLVVLGPSPITKPGLALEAGKTLDVGPIRMDGGPAPP